MAGIPNPGWSALASWRAVAAELSTRELWGWTAANNETRGCHDGITALLARICGVRAIVARHVAIRSLLERVLVGPT